MTGRLEWPDPTPYDEPEDCDVCRYDEEDDPLTGRVSCVDCRRQWYLTAEEIAANSARQRRIDDAEKQAMFDGFDPTVYRMAIIGQPTTIKPLEDDELPF